MYPDKRKPTLPLPYLQTSRSGLLTKVMFVSTIKAIVLKTYQPPRRLRNTTVTSHSDPGLGFQGPTFGHERLVVEGSAYRRSNFSPKGSTDTTTGKSRENKKKKQEKNFWKT